MKKLFITLLLVLFPLQTFGATTFLESGTDATQDGKFYQSFVGGGTTGTVTSDTSQFHTGGHSIKVSSGVTSGGGAALTPNGAVSDAGTHISVWFRSDTFATGNQIVSPNTSAGGDVMALRFGTNTVNINNSQGTNLATGAKTLSTNTWYHLELVYTITNATTFNIKTYINGVLDASAVNNGTLPGTATSQVGFGMSTNAAANQNIWFDDIYITNVANFATAGDIRVTAKRPFANGTTNGFTTQIGTGGSGYGTGHSPQVNEQPLSTTNGWSMIGAGSAVTEEYNIEGLVVGSTPLNSYQVVDTTGWLYASSLASETGSIIVNGATSNISLTSTNTMFTKATGSTTYPNGSGTDIGIVTTTALTTVSLYEAGTLVAFTQPFNNMLMGMAF